MRTGDGDEAAGRAPLITAPSRSEAVDIKRVAALAGVSIATVSRAVSDPNRVNAATRERVLEIVRQTGYTPNTAGRSLRAARTMMLLLVVPAGITPFFSELHQGVDGAASAQGYGLIVGSLHGEPEKSEQRLVNLVFSGQADGILLLSGRMLQAGHRLLTDAGVPIVAISSIPQRTNDMPAVLVQDREGAAAMACHLLELGHRHFGYIAGPSDSYVEHERWAGFITTLAAADVAAESVVRYPGDFQASAGLEAGRRFLDSKRRPTAVFAMSDMMAIGFMRAVRDAGLNIPGDVSVAGFDGIEFADYCEPPLTTVRQPSETMGREGTELLVRLIRGERLTAEARTLRLEVMLRPAASTGPPAVRRRRRIY
jgi:LacI family repressor for deo operon, udp, cdd, tsx, nupC, and nupG